MKKKVSLKNTLLTSFFFVYVLFFLVISFWSADRLGNNMENDAISKNTMVANEVARELGSFMEDLQQHFFQTARVLEKGIIPVEKYNEYLTAFVGDNYFFDMVKILNQEGIITNSFPYDPNTIGLDMSNQDYFKNTRSNDKPYWSKTYVSMQTGRPTLTLGIPFENGLLVGHINLVRLNEITDNIKIGEHGYASITDNMGITIAHPDRTLIYERFNMSYFNYIKQGLDGNSGAYKYLLSDKYMLATTAIEAHTGWVVSIVQPLDEILEPVQEIKFVIYVVGIISCILALVIVRISLHFLLTPFTNFVEESKRVSEGDYSRQFKTSTFIEINRLVQSFNSMIYSVKEREKSLCKEILERKQTEDRLIINETILNKSQEISHLGSWHLNLKNNILTWSDEQYRIFGRTPQEFGATYEAFLDIIHPDDRDIVDKTYTLAIKNNTPYECVHRIVIHDGEIRVVLEKSEDVVDENGKAIHSFGYTQDITEQVFSNQRYEFIIKTSIDGFWLVDKNTNILEVNDAYCKLIGYSRQELLKMSISDLEAVESVAEIRQHIEQIIDNGYGRFESKHRRKDGKTIDVEVSVNVIKYTELCVVVFIRDISERKRTEKERKELETRLMQAQKMEAIGNLAGGVAHDFNNILAIVQGNVDILNRELKHDEKLLKRTETALKGISRAAGITQRLLKFSRPKSLSSQVILINQTISEMEWLMEKTAMKAIEIKLVLSPDLWLTEINEGDFQDALLNLVLNAKDAMSEAGEIVIETANKVLEQENVISNQSVDVDVDVDAVGGEYVLISVRDSGSGISEEKLRHVFEPFFTTKAAGKGTGLGLSMVYGFVKRSKGHIQLHSQPGQGTTVQIYLPRSVKSDNEQQELNTNNIISKGHETILIVDDEEELLELASYNLKALGYQVITAVNALDALEILAKDNGKIDLLFSDIIMPGSMDGFALAKQVIEQNLGIKVLLTSGYTDNPDKLKKLAKFKVRLLEKPYSEKELARQVRNVLDDEKL